eukprot:TRINITY_DN2687_c0_g1_i12.p1 TRINITY_DN2687_c0_g1~~TRINITY_DN2687_c0_g1_i12.p1  ORF type:complete len:421 (+),score=61.13 TRINITY_DN2687_c0_g1_i12:174-1265(+)
MATIADKLKYTTATTKKLIIAEGDIGTEMFFLISGEVEILNLGRVVKTLSDGAFFGEVALLYGDKRTATIRAKSFCHLYSLTKDDFQTALDSHPACIDAIYGTAQETKHLKEHFIKKIPLFKDVAGNAEFVLNISMALKSCSYHPKQPIIQEGEYGSEMFFIARGETEVTKEDKHLAVLKQGDFFGEMALLFCDRRNATISATNYCHLYCLTQEAFETMAVAFPKWWESINSSKHLFKRAPPPSSTTTTTKTEEAPTSKRTVRSSVHGLILPSFAAPPTDVSSSVEVKKQSTSTQPTTPASTDSKEKLEQVLSERQCLICVDKEKNMVVVPCGHVSACEICIKPLRKCPICRGPIQSTMKLFF